MHERILVVTDGSLIADRAVEVAAEFAELLDATLHVLYVVDRRVARIGYARATYRQIGEDALKKATRTARRRNVETATELSEGDPSRAILEYARVNRIDLIILGENRKATVERLLMGSTAEKVLRRDSPSVLVVRETASGPPRGRP